VSGARWAEHLPTVLALLLAVAAGFLLAVWLLP
jgi:uncharacterized integral membrane protein